MEANIHHKDRLTYSGGTDRPGELRYIFFFSSNFTQMVNFPIQSPDCDSHSPALLDLSLSSDASMCSTMAFPPFRNSDHVVLVLIDFPSNSQQDALFNRIGYDYSRAYMIFGIIWEMFHGRISLNSVLLLLLVSFLSCFKLELMHTGWAKKTHPNLILLYQVIDLNNTKKPLGLSYLI